MHDNRVHRQQFKVAWSTFMLLTFGARVSDRGRFFRSSPLKSAGFAARVARRGLFPVSMFYQHGILQCFLSRDSLWGLSYLCQLRVLHMLVDLVNGPEIDQIPDPLLTAPPTRLASNSTITLVEFVSRKGCKLPVLYSIGDAFVPTVNGVPIQLLSDQVGGSPLHHAAHDLGRLVAKVRHAQDEDITSAQNLVRH